MHRLVNCLGVIALAACFGAATRDGVCPADGNCPDGHRPAAAETGEALVQRFVHSSSAEHWGHPVFEHHRAFAHQFTGRAFAQRAARAGPARAAAARIAAAHIARSGAARTRVTTAHAVAQSAKATAAAARGALEASRRLQRQTAARMRQEAAAGRRLLHDHDKKPKAAKAQVTGDAATSDALKRGVSAHAVEPPQQQRLLLNMSQNLAAAPARKAMGGASPAPAPQSLAALASAPQPHLIKSEVARAQKVEEMKESGDLAFTVHGCHCVLNWTHDGIEEKGCSKNTAEFASGWHWCEVDETCVTHEGELTSGQKWDFCSVPGEVHHDQTVHGCHCAPHWEYNGTIYESCARTSQGPTWCYVFETDAMCPQAMRTDHGGQHWDHCFLREQTSGHLTKSGCHCMPEWEFDGEKRSGCSAVENEEGVRSWCLTHEDATSCPFASLLEDGSSLVWDHCPIPTGEEEIISSFVVALDERCHCQPFWMHNGTEYQGCASTPSRPRGWCYIVEDERLCPEADGFGEGDERFQRWRHCEALPSTAVAVPDRTPAPNRSTMAAKVMIWRSAAWTTPRGVVFAVLAALYLRVLV